MVYLPVALEEDTAEPPGPYGQSRLRERARCFHKDQPCSSPCLSKLLLSHALAHTESHFQ